MTKSDSFTQAGRDKDGRVENIMRLTKDLYYCGNLELLSRKIVWVIGSRSPSPYGRRLGEDICSLMSGSETAVCFGTRIGMDTMLCDNAEKKMCASIIALPFGADFFEDFRFRDSLINLASKGLCLLLSPFERDRAEDKESRILALKMLSAVCSVPLLLECSDKRFLNMCFEFIQSEGKDLLSIPGSIYNIASRLPNEMIVDGCGVVSGINNVLDYLKET